jgi:nitrite reductase (NO-forming)
MRLRTTALLTAGLLAFALAGCGDDGDSPGPANGATPAVGENGTVEIDVVMGDMFYQPDSVEIPSGTTLIVNASNEGMVEHDFVIDGEDGTGLVQPGESATAEFGPFTEDTTAYCTVPGHREAGMEFEIRVTD